MSFQEQPLWIRSAAEPMLGVLSLPAAADRGLLPHAAVLIVIGGPQYRAGSHRQFTLIARALAAAGLAVLRFDHRGAGDSPGEPRSFEELSPDIEAAIAALREQIPGLRRIGLLGLCDGASASLLYLGSRVGDAPVTALCLLNPWVRSVQSLARTHVKHYYLRRLLQGGLWAQLLRGRLPLRSLGEFLRSLLKAAGPTSNPPAPTTGPGGDFRQRMLGALQGFEGRVLIVASGLDFVAREFDELTSADSGWQRALRLAKVRRVALEGADHTFSDPAAQQGLQDELLGFFAPMLEPADAAA